MTKPVGSARKPSGFRCDECGTTSIRWVGRCPECQAWGSMTDAGSGVVALAPATGGPIRAAARPIGDHDAAAAQLQHTGIGELDRVLGGGLVPGSVVLLAGEPGVGKSTLLLEVARSFAAGNGKSLIVTGEESTAQVRMRAGRTGALHPKLFLAAENDLSAIYTHVDQVSPGLLIVDSVQTITTGGVESGAGSATQVRAVAAGLIALAKQRGIATVLVGHVTKDGAIAGPRMLEHLVDVVLQFEGDRHSSLRLLRAVKNRYGAVDEVGCFEMREQGIAGLADPSGLFLSRRTAAVPGTCVTVTIEGRRPLLTEVQSLITRADNGGSARRSVTDLDAARVAMVLAVLGKHAHLKLAEKDVYTASVGGLKITEPAADLAVALAMWSAEKDEVIPAALCAVGELDLSGDVRRVSALPKRLAEAARLGFRTALVPAGGEPTNVKGIRVVPVDNLGAAIEACVRAPLLQSVRRIAP